MVTSSRVTEVFEGKITRRSKFLSERNGSIELDCERDNSNRHMLFYFMYHVGHSDPMITLMEGSSLNG